jgi:hypothetical protein
MQKVACTTERGERLLVFGMSSSRLYEGVQIIAQLVEVPLPLCTPLIDPLFGQAQCLGLDPTGANAANLYRAHQPRAFEHGKIARRVESARA